MPDQDVRLDLDRPFPEGEIPPVMEVSPEEGVQNVDTIPQEPTAEPSPEPDDDSKKNATSENWKPCDKCNGTGLADYQLGREATKMCPICNGSGRF